MGNFVGAILRWLRESPTTEIMVCRNPTADWRSGDEAQPFRRDANLQPPTPAEFEPIDLDAVAEGNSALVHLGRNQ
jgi:hypothetical protein